MIELVEYSHEGKTFIGTPQQFVDKLTYANYAYNRQRSPEITPEGWKMIYGTKTVLMEQCYQHDLSHPNP